MPTGRRKVVHSVGGVCKIALDIKNSIYTGMLKNGPKMGIIRMGSARDISNGEIIDKLEDVYFYKKFTNEVFLINDRLEG